MKKLVVGFLFITTSLLSQTINYNISFKNAVHHEAHVTINYSDLSGNTLELQMSNASPGRYAIHNFAKNVYGVKALDANGNTLNIKRVNPYTWEVNHNGTVTVSYILFANRADGTYSQVDETHAHLNMPATFMYSKALEKTPITINFETRDDLQWKVATQLKPVSNTTFWAPNLQYFMDSPTEISNFSMRSFDVDGKTIRFALHHNGTETEVDEYFTSVKKIVLEQKEVYGELPNFDFDTYTFLACYLPHVNGDGMEHRNSTILTSTRGLAQGGMQGNLGTVSHEFFHAWNVERIRPQSLEPFDFSKANMSGELWFAEGFTSYYTNLILCRAGLITPERYIKGLTGTFNYVWNSPGRQFFNPIQMSYQAPFVDAATSLDPVNRNNTFISYYSYGSVLGLALDLSLREKGLNLDSYMKLVWNTYGKNETPYTIKNLQDALANYASPEFAENFFSNYIYKSKMPDYKRLLQNMGVSLSQINTSGYLGVFFDKNKVRGNAAINSPAYNAGLERGATIKKINDIEITKDSNINSILKDFKEGDTLTIIFEQLGKEKTATVTLAKNPSYTISVNEEASQQQLINRDKWLN